MVMQVLVVIAHADHNEKTWSHRIADVTKNALEEDGHEVRIIDLVNAGFDKTASFKDFKEVKNTERYTYSAEQNPSNMIEEIAIQQKNLLWCSHMIIIGPMWFTRYPSTLYAYLERVFTFGFSHDYMHARDSGFLKGRKIMCVMTAGGPARHYTPSGAYGSLEGLLFHITVGHFWYVGMTPLRSQGFYAMKEGPETEELFRKWAAAVKNLDNRPTIPIITSKFVEEGQMTNPQIIAALPDYPIDEAITAK